MYLLMDLSRLHHLNLKFLPFVYQCDKVISWMPDNSLGHEQCTTVKNQLPSPLQSKNNKHNKTIKNKNIHSDLIHIISKLSSYMRIYPFQEELQDIYRVYMHIDFIEIFNFGHKCRETRTFPKPIIYFV